MKQTAVEWLFQELDNYYQMEGNVIKKEILKQAKEMEKEQQGYSEDDMKKAFNSSSLTNMLDVYDSFEEFMEQFKKK
jgi:molecular chaperone GrpE (heat shock protein)